MGITGYEQLIKPLAFAANILSQFDADDKNSRITFALARYNDVNTPLEIDNDIFNTLFDSAKEIDDKVQAFQKGGDEYEELRTEINKFINKEPYTKAKQIIINNNSYIYEEIGGAAKVVVKYKPEDDDNTAPTIEAILATEAESIISNAVTNYNDNNIIDKLKEFTTPKYLESQRRIINQAGGYKYNDLAKIVGNTITIGDGCELTDKTTYGPFANLYTPQYNNFDIYAYLFGTYNMSTSADKSVIQFRPPAKKPANMQTKDEDIIYNDTNIGQNLINKLRSGGNVVLFGYGFSGSGKTYTLLEGQRYKSIDKVISDLSNDKDTSEEHKTLLNTYLTELKKPQSQPGSPKQSGLLRQVSPQTQGGDGVRTELQKAAYHNIISNEDLLKKIKDTIKSQQYDPSLLEEFIKENTDNIQSVEFVEIYPLGEGDGGKNKIYCDKDDSNKSKYGDGVVEVDDIYKKIEGNITFEIINTRIKEIEKYRKSKLRILSTPNNDNSSRSFFQLTINLDKDNKLVFFDMPGTENTVRIKQELLGNETFGIVQTTYDNNKTNLNNLGTVALLDNLKHFFNFVQDKNSNLLILQRILNPPDITGETLKKHKDLLRQKLTEKFKDIIITATNFAKLTGINANPQYPTISYIGKTSEELLLFFSRENVNDVFESSNPIVILQKEQIAEIVKFFLKKVIFQDREYNPESGTIKYKYFTLKHYTKADADKKTLELNDQDKNNIEKIFSIYFPETTEKPDNVPIWGNKLSYNIYGENEPQISLLNTKMRSKTGSLLEQTKQPQQPQQPQPTMTPSNRQIFDLFEMLEDKNTPQSYFNDLKRTTYNFEYTNKDNECVMIKYFIIIMNTVFYNCAKENKTVQEFYCAMSIFVYKYVKFIVDQGSAIVTNLEHLKFFFLANTNNIPSYNRNVEENDKEDDATKPKIQPFLYSYNTDSKQSNILDNPITYTKPTTVGKGIKMDETINIGEMKKYKLLSILQTLANQNYNLDELITRDNNLIDLFKKTKTSGAAKQTTNIKSLFVMFTNIKIYTGKKDATGVSLNKKLFAELDTSLKENICTAQYDTLEFAQNISSTTQGKPKVNAAAATTVGGSLNRYNYKTSKFHLNTLTRKHQNIKTHKSITLKKRKHNNNNNNKRGQTLFVRRSKKYFN